MDGKHSVQVDGLSKLTKIEELRKRLEEMLNVSPDRQRLFFTGKQLEDGRTLFDYSVNVNSIVQLMIRHVEKPNLTTDVTEDSKELSPSEQSHSSSTGEDPTSDENKENEATPLKHEARRKGDPYLDSEASSSMVVDDAKAKWKIKDLVDGKDLTMGAWFEAEIVKIDASEKGEYRYHVVFEGYDENEIVPLSGTDIRPRARTKVPFDQIEAGMVVMANYNSDEPKERGFWYDIKVTRKVSKRSCKEVYGKLLLGKDDSSAQECKIIFIDEIFKIESSEEVSTVPAVAALEKRKVKPDCDHCKDDPLKNCKECSCHVCGSKEDPEKTLMCDECDMAYHMACLNPPLDALPEDDDWYCPLCKNDGSDVVKAGDKFKGSSKKTKMASANSTSNRDWGKGMACVGRTKVCTIVPPNHFGPVPGVPVGSCWKFRLQASEAGVHRPHVSGIHGRDSDGAYSIVLAGGYEDDKDDGDEFLYTGSGGRDLSGNKRTAEQSCDQTLTRMNRALAKNCDAKLDDKKGADARNWRSGKPIRVLRSYKGAKHSEYAPDDGVRYDGIYKVVKYWPEKGQSGFIVWRYQMRRDDEEPAPWTKPGKKRIKELGLEIQYPDGYLEAQAKKDSEKQAAKSEKKKRKREEDDEDEGDDSPGSGASDLSPTKKAKPGTYKVPKDFANLIGKDSLNEKIWTELLSSVESHKKLLEAVEEKFMCICCQEVVHQPVTLECNHNFCKSCLQRACKAGVQCCPFCRNGLDKGYELKVNEALSDALKKLFPGYSAGRC